MLVWVDSTVFNYPNTYPFPTLCGSLVTLSRTKSPQDKSGQQWLWVSSVAMMYCLKVHVSLVVPEGLVQSCLFLMTERVHPPHFQNKVNDPGSQPREISGFVSFYLLGCQLPPHWGALSSAMWHPCWPFELATKQKGTCARCLDRPRSHFKDSPSSYIKSTQLTHEQTWVPRRWGLGTVSALPLRASVPSWAQVLDGPMTRQ